MKLWKIIAALATMTCVSQAGSAAMTKLHVQDASVLLYMIDSSNRIYFRNFDAVDSSWQPCCFAYWIDLSTDWGKSQLSNFLSARLSHGSIDFWVEKSGGPIFGTGNF